MPKIRFSLLVLALGTTLTLSACESPQDRAEKFYQSALALIEDGQEEQAILEFRNVFKYDGAHREARRTYADLLLARGETGQAMGQYLRLIEQYPGETEVRWMLAENSLSQGNWEEVRRHGTAALEQAPEALRSRVLGLAIEYQKVKTDRRRAEQKAVIDRAQAVLDAEGYNDILMRLVIDYELTGDDRQLAMPYVDAALEANPMALDLQQLRFRLLAESADVAGTGGQLQRMFELFPEDKSVQRGLVQWHLMQQDFAGAEAFLRELAGPPDGPAEAHVSVIQMIQATRGPEAAQEELAKLTAANTGTDNAILYASLAATIDFEQGRQEDALTKMRDIIAAAEDGSRKREAQAVLARMLDSIGQRDEAETLVDSILEADSGLTAALKLRASWLISEDKPGQAIVVLRKALDQKPDDSETLTLMAAAHEREGNSELATERLALALEASNSAPEESLRYVKALLNQGRNNSAATVLEDSLRLNPTHVPMLIALAELRMNKAEWGAAQEVIDRLREIPTPEAEAAAQELQAGTLLGQDRVEESLSFLQAGLETAKDDDETTRSIILIVQTQISSGKLDEARSYLNDVLTEMPDNPRLRLLGATLDAMRGDLDSAETGYRALIADHPTSEAPVRMLTGLLSATGRGADAREVLQAALTAMPKSLVLRMMQADMLQQDGDIDAAITLYEEMYAEDSNNVILTNNLSSLLATHRTDEASMTRAFEISRRLRGVAIPAVQDTYGWIEYLRGNYEDALPYLEAAAKGLPEDPTVQMHLGLTYAQLSQVRSARTTLTRALELADSPLPSQFEPARAALEALPDPS